jgi:mannose/fructose/N-acetylgalactosamine-specific phosphotransferase system component IID
MRRRGLTLVLAVLLALSTIGFAHAQANEQASCTAVLASAFGPGSGIGDEVHEVQAIAEALGVPFGQLAKALAQSHGTLEECLALIPIP